MSVTIGKGMLYGLVGLALLGVLLGGAALAFVMSTPAQPAKTQKFRIIMGEGEVIAEIQGEDQVTGEYHRWEPGTIVVHQGDMVVLEIVNPRKHIHSFALSAFNVDTGPLQARGGSMTVQFVADKAGVFMWVCGTPHNHETNECDPDHDTMVGYLVVLA